MLPDPPPLLRVGVIGDVHAQHDKLRVVLRALRAHGVDRILCVGDIADGPGDLSACCALLDAPDVSTVCGNHERWILQGTMRTLPHAHDLREEPADVARFLEALPVTQRFATVAGDLLLCHAVGSDDMAVLKSTMTENEAFDLPAMKEVLNSAPSLMVCGHTHERMVRRVGSMVVINAGTLLSEGPACFGVVELATRLVRSFELGGSDAQCEVINESRQRFG